jgi:hypothetical protein
MVISRTIALVATLSVVALGMGACVGKAPGVGFGKAPPPAPAPVEAPIVRKG